MEVLLKDICEMQSGGTPKRSNSLYYGGGIPWVTISDFKNAEGDVIYTTDETLSKEGLEEINGRLFKKGTLLLAMYGSVGKTALLGVDASTNQAILGIRSKDERTLNIKYLKYWLDHNKEFIYSQGKGATLHNISLTIVQRQKINLPDLETQNKIVAILDKAKALLDKRERTIAIYDELLRATFLEMFGDPVKNDKAWTTLPFDKTGKFFSGGTPDKSNPQFWIGSFPWVSPKDMKVPTIEDSQDHISVEVFEKTSLRRIAPDHLLIVVRGMILAHSFPTAINAVEITINQDMKAIKPIDDLHVVFLQHCVKTMTPYILSLISSAGHGTKKFDSEAMKKIDIPVPPMSLQMSFVHIASKIKSLRTRLDTSHSKIKTIYNALSNIAFKGELTFNTAVDLEVLLENDYESFKRDASINTIQLLIDRLEKGESNNQKFHESTIYEKAKSFVFELMREGKVKQTFDEQTKSVKLTLA